MVTDPASAETIKYASNAFLATKLSFVNAVAAVCEAVGADVNDVVLGMGYDKRIGHEFLRPGPGWGGCCFPKDTQALVHIAEDAGYDFDLLEGVVEVNDEQFDRVADKIVRDGRRLASTGRSSPCGASPSRPAPTTCASRRRSQIIERLLDRGRQRAGLRPDGRREPLDRAARGIEIVADPYAAVRGRRVLAVLTEWDEFKWLDLDKVADAHGRRVASSTPATCSTAPRSRRRGFDYQGIGRS